MTSAKKTDPDLWEEVKDEITQSDKGGEPGQWSARKAQMAVQEYKKRGGGYEDQGPDQSDTDLNQWTEEDWGTKSGEESLESGERYLPKKVRMLLTADEYRRSTQKKKDADEQYVDQPDDVEDKVSTIKKDGPTRKMLVDRAKDLGLSGYSDMSKDELLEAIDDATDENGRRKGGELTLQEKTKDELYDIAQDEGIDGRSDMSKDELIDAISKARQGLSDMSKDALYEKAQEEDIEGRSGMSKDELVRALQD